MPDAPKNRRKSVEIALDDGADQLIRQLGRGLGTRTRSRVLQTILDYARSESHVSELMEWLSEQRFLPDRRTTLRLPPHHIRLLESLAETCDFPRTRILANLVYYVACHADIDDLKLYRDWK